MKVASNRIGLRFSNESLFLEFFRLVGGRFCPGQWWVASTDQGCFLSGTAAPLLEAEFEQWLKRFAGLNSDPSALDSVFAEPCAELKLSQLQRSDGEPEDVHQVLSTEGLQTKSLPLGTRVLYRGRRQRKNRTALVTELRVGSTFGELIRPQPTIHQSVPDLAMLVFPSFQTASHWLLQALHLDTPQIRCAFLTAESAEPSSVFLEDCVCAAMITGTAATSAVLVQVTSPSWFLIDDQPWPVFVEQFPGQWTPIGTDHPLIRWSSKAVSGLNVYAQSGLHFRISLDSISC